MFNLLPIDFKEAIKKEYRMRKLIVILFFLIALEATFIIFVLPTWLSSFYRERVITSQYEEMKGTLSNASTTSVNLDIKNINSKLGVISSSMEYPKLLPFIDVILKQKNSSITIDQFVYSFIDKTSADLTIRGVSSQRETLVSFVKRLEETGVFKKVNLPIGNLAKDRDISFTLNLTIAQ